MDKLFLKYFILICLIFAVSCKKEKCLISNTKISGKIINKATNEPIKGIEVKLHRIKKDFYPFGHLKIRSEKSNKDGTFTIRFNAQDDYDYMLCFVEYDEFYRYFPGEDGLSFEINDIFYEFFYLVEKKDKINLDKIYLFPKTLLNIKVKNINPYDNNDKIIVKTTGVNINYEFQGPSVDTNHTFNVSSSAYQNIYWQVIKNNIHKFYSDSIYCSYDATNEFNIEY